MKRKFCFVSGLLDRRTRSREILVKRGKATETAQVIVRMGNIKFEIFPVCP